MINPPFDITYSSVNPAHFICSTKIVQQFINHLNAQNVLVQPPQPAFDQNGTTFCELELVTTIDEVTADEIISSFKP
jgi:hypothetical protein